LVTNYFKIRSAVLELFHRYGRTDRVPFIGIFTGFDNVSEKSHLRGIAVCNFWLFFPSSVPCRSTEAGWHTKYFTFNTCIMC